MRDTLFYSLIVVGWLTSNAIPWIFTATYMDKLTPTVTVLLGAFISSVFSIPIFLAFICALTKIEDYFFPSDDPMTEKIKALTE